MADILDNLQASGLGSWRAESSFQTAATVIVYYDYCITFSDEVRCIWQRKLSGVTILFLLNRYAYLLDRAAALVQMISWDRYSEETANKICTAAVQIDMASTALLYFVLAAMASFRAYAICPENRLIAAVVLFLGLLNPGFIAYESSKLSVQAALPPFAGCAVSNSFTHVLYILEVCSTFVTELVVLVLTWKTTARALKVLSQKDIALPLTRLLLRDGTVYFLIATISATVPIGLGVASPMTDPIISICISRFLLSLRQSYLSDGSNLSDGSQPFSHASFAVRTVGNLGASLSWTSHDAAQNDHWDDPKEDFPHVSNDPLLTTLVWDSLADGSMIREDLDKNMEVTESGCEKMAV